MLFGWLNSLLLKSLFMCPVLFFSMLRFQWMGPNIPERKRSPRPSCRYDSQNSPDNASWGCHQHRQKSNFTILESSVRRVRTWGDASGFIVKVLCERTCESPFEEKYDFDRSNWRFWPSESRGPKRRREQKSWDIANASSKRQLSL